MIKKDFVIFEKTSSSYGNTVKGYSFILDNVYTHTHGKLEMITKPFHALIDDTQGYGAMDTLPFLEGTRNLDIGGGQWDDISEYILRKYRVINLVYDPFGRTTEHNASIITEVRKSPVDSVTSNSVMNVILDETVRLNHIKLAYDSLKLGGIAFFKIWRGNSSGIVGPNINSNSKVIQVNKEAKHFVREIETVFGINNAEIIPDNIGNTIVAYKKRVKFIVL